MAYLETAFGAPSAQVSDMESAGCARREGRSPDRTPRPTESMTKARFDGPVSEWEKSTGFERSAIHT